MSTEYMLVNVHDFKKWKAFDSACSIGLAKLVQMLSDSYPDEADNLKKWGAEVELPYISTSFRCLGIGQRTGGWRFLFTGKFTTLSALEEYMRQVGPDWMILDEYNGELTFSDFSNKVLEARLNPHVPDSFAEIYPDVSNHDVLLSKYAYRKLNGDGDHLSTHREATL